MKKLTAILLALMLILSVTQTALATVYTEGYLHYTISDESITVTGYFGDEETVTVPAMIAGIPVNTIASGAFAGSGIQALNLPDTITGIEGGAVDAGVAIHYNSNLPSGGPEQPEPTQPEPTQPASTQPDPTQPDPTDPTQPKPTQPKPTQPPRTKQSAAAPSTEPTYAIEEVEIDLAQIEALTPEMTDSTEETAAAAVTEGATEAVTEGAAQTVTEAATEAAAEPAESDPPKPFAAVMAVIAGVIGLVLAGVLVWKKKK